ncbi:redoxin domain-containing protein [Streptomyces anthocyanicus]|uniref:redoxin domain-containing protein n=3 Tax=Streptomyces anthocyanicus TaxID=68174 RepID=UPI00216B0F83|nr:redoxin domain-containing protein [Streptomyces anthocyanicus]
MGELLFGTTLLASFLGGMVALLAPCCISVMLPAYFATGFRSRGRVVAGTLAFGAGVATVIVPIGLGATALSALFQRYHLWIYLTGGVLMLAGGLAVLAGWKPKMPMPSGGTPRQGGGFKAAYGLGAFSGVATACCAPVLAGVVVLSGASGSFLAALGVALIYVLGMVAPLVVIALAWERGHRGPAKLLEGRQVPLRLGPWRRRVPLGDLLSGGLLVAMGVLTSVLAFTGSEMSASGWRVRLSADLTHFASRITDALSWLPGWVVALAAAAALVLLIRRTLRPAAPAAAQSDGADAPGPAAPAACCAGTGSDPGPLTATSAADTDRTTPMETPPMAAEIQHAPKPGSKAARREKARQQREAERLQEQQEQRNRRLRRTALVTAAVVAVTGGLYLVFDRSEQAAQNVSYEVGKPGIGKTAPGFDLASSTGGKESLADHRGETVLLFFQEGGGCQPCWDQITDLEKSWKKVKGLGVDSMLSITTDPADLVKRKAKDDGIKTPVLSDPDLKVSKEYTTNQYGMMGTSKNGHSFVLVGPDGKIQWRADYGGAPDYTMYVKVDKLLSDLKAGRKA